jgi:hypothetical protein
LHRNLVETSFHGFTGFLQRVLVGFDEHRSSGGRSQSFEDGFCSIDGVYGLGKVSSVCLEDGMSVGSEFLGGFSLGGGGSDGSFSLSDISLGVVSFGDELVDEGVGEGSNLLLGFSNVVVEFFDH